MIFVGYHGSHAPIASRPEAFRATASADYGPGFYFATNWRDTVLHGAYVYRATLQLENPLVVTGFDPVGEADAALRQAMAWSGIDYEEIAMAGGLMDPWATFFDLYRVLVEMGMQSYPRLGRIFDKLGYDSVLVQNHALARRWQAEGSKSAPAGDYICVRSPTAITAWEELPFGVNDERSKHYGVGLRGRRVW
jgi:hypothetical protein